MPHIIKMALITTFITSPTKYSDYKPGDADNLMFVGKQTIMGPARLAGNVLLLHETIDQIKEPRRAWIYNAGQRRVRRAPQVAYDGPGTAADGMRTAVVIDVCVELRGKNEYKLRASKRNLRYRAFAARPKAGSELI